MSGIGLSWRVGQFIRESGSKDREMVKENKNGLMGHDIKGNGEMEKQMAKVNYIMLMVLYTKENSLMIKQKEMGHTPRLTE